MAFLVLCIMYIPYHSDVCLLRSVLYTPWDFDLNLYHAVGLITCSLTYNCVIIHT